MRCSNSPSGPDPLIALSARVARLEAAAAQTSQFLTTGQTAERLGIDRTTLWRWINRGDVPTVKVGNRHRIPASWVADQLTAEVAR